MKRALNLVLGCCVLALVACESAEKTDDASAGAFADQPSACCAEKAADASPGAVGECSSSCSEKAAEASPGAVSDCSSSCSGAAVKEAEATCPYSGSDS